MQPYDMLMIVVLVGTTVWGAWKGMAWQAASLASLVVSYFVALKFSDVLAPYISNQAPWNRFVAMLVLYLATAAAIWLAFSCVSNAIERVRLKEFDRQVGGLFGAAKGVVICLVITFFAVTLSEVARAKVLESRSGHYITVLIDRATPIIPPELHEMIGPYLARLNNELDPNHRPAEQGGWPVPGFNTGSQDGTTWNPGVWNDPAAAGQGSGWPAGSWPPANPAAPADYRETFDAAQRWWNDAQTNAPPGGFPANR